MSLGGCAGGTTHPPLQKFTICVCILLSPLDFCSNPSVITLSFHPHYDLPVFPLWRSQLVTFLVFSLKHNPGTITLLYLGIIIHYFQLSTRKRLGCHPCPVNTHSPMSSPVRGPTHALSHSAQKINPQKINKTISFPSGIISQKRDQTEELEKAASGSSAGTRKESEEKTIIKRL